MLAGRLRTGGGGEDCNGNGIADAIEIAGNPALDCFSAGAVGVIGGPDGVLNICQCARR